MIGLSDFPNLNSDTDCLELYLRMGRCDDNISFLNELIDEREKRRVDSIESGQTDKAEYIQLEIDHFKNLIEFYKKMKSKIRKSIQQCN